MRTAILTVLFFVLCRPMLADEDQWDRDLAEGKISREAYDQHRIAVATEAGQSTLPPDVVEVNFSGKTYKFRLMQENVPLGSRKSGAQSQWTGKDASGAVFNSSDAHTWYSSKGRQLDGTLAEIKIAVVLKIDGKPCKPIGLENFSENDQRYIKRRVATMALPCDEKPQPAHRSSPEK